MIRLELYVTDGNFRTRQNEPPYNIYLLC